MGRLRLPHTRKEVHQMTTFTGKGVYGAVALGKVSVFKRRETTVKMLHVDDTEAEKARLAAAKEAAIAQLQEIYDKALKEVGEANAQIFEIHMMMIEDDDYNESIESIIDTQSVNAEYAVSLTADNFAEMFASMDDAYMQARSADVKDISNRIICVVYSRYAPGGENRLSLCVKVTGCQAVLHVIIGIADCRIPVSE